VGQIDGTAMPYNPTFYNAQTLMMTIVNLTVSVITDYKKKSKQPFDEKPKKARIY